MKPTKPKIAIVHDWLTNYAGAEQVLKSLLEIYQDAPVYTSVYKPEKFPQIFKDRKIYTSSLQKYSFVPHQLLFPYMGKAFEQFDLSEYDIVITSSHASSKGVITKPETLNICYCHTPTRYLWSHYFEYLDQMQFGVLSPIIKRKMPKIAHKLRIWDRSAADRVDFWIANSQNTQKRIKKYYKKKSVVINPPVNTELFKPSGIKKDYYLTCSRLIPYKKIDIVIKAFNKMGLPLKIIGTGPKEKEYKKMAKNNVEILGRVSDKELKKYYAQAKIFIFPAEEDFGIVPVEAMSSGIPVIAYDKGGVTETVIHKKTGILFSKQTPRAIENAILEAEKINFDPTIIRKHAQTFSTKNFKEKLKKFVEKKFQENINEA